MRSLPSCVVLTGGLLGMLCVSSPAGAEEIPKEYRPTIEKALKWLVKQQQPDGRFEGTRGNYPVSMTSLAGMALLMEGSTLREGKYRNHIRRAADFVMRQAKSNGLIGEPSNSTMLKRSNTRVPVVRTCEETICTRCWNNACASASNKPERSPVSTSSVAKDPS